MRWRVCLLCGRGYTTFCCVERMKVRVKVGSLRVPLVLETTPESSLGSLKQQIVERVPLSSGEACSLSLNGTDVLDESLSLAELEIVSGDVLYCLSPELDPVVAAAAPSVAREREQDGGVDTGATEEPLSREGGSELEREVSQSHFEDLCLSLRLSESVGSRSQCATLCSALHTLMLDTGFTHTQECHQLNDSAAKWSYATPINSEVKVHLACVKMGPRLSIHGIATVEKQRLRVSLCLPISSHMVREGERGWVIARPSELATAFKDSISHKLLTYIRKEMGLPEVGTFSSLFPELKLLVCRRLDVRSLLSLSATNRELHCICQDPFLWKALLLRDFGRVAATLSSKSWKQVYIEQFKMAVERKRQLSAITFPPALPAPSFLPHQPHLPPFPLIIGGRYDWLPQLPPHLRLGGDPSITRRHGIRDHLTQPLLPNPDQEFRSNFTRLQPSLGTLAAPRPRLI